MKRLGLMVLTAALAICLTACGGISKSVDLKYGDTYKIEDEKLSGKENLTWESDDSSIISVSEDGTVTANAPGKAKVSIKEGDKSIGTYTFDVTTVPIEQIIFSTDPIEITKDDTIAVKYTLIPQNASDYGITWTCSDESVAKLKTDNGIELTGWSVGKATIVASTESNVVFQCAIEVIPKSAYEQLNDVEKQFVDEILLVMNNFKNPSSVQFNSIYKLDAGFYVFEASAQNGFGGNSVATYLYDKASNTFMEWDSVVNIGRRLNAKKVTEAVHEKLGY